MIYGNCQAEALRDLFLESEAIRARFNVVRIPPVHLISAKELPDVMRLVEKSRLLVMHPVRAGYRGMALGTDALREAAPSQSTVLTTLPLYYEGLHPFQVYVHVDGDVGVSAPLVDYHDLRFLYCARQGWTDAEALDWLRWWRPDQDALRDYAARSLSRLAERDESVDVKVSSAVQAELAGGGIPFHTVNHPSNGLMRRIVGGLWAKAGIDATFDGWNDELLGEVRAPVEPAIAEALRLDAPTDYTWLAHGARIPNSDILKSHLQWYRETRPDALAAGIREHRTRLRHFGLE